jgi:hypothetical protein
MKLANKLLLGAAGTILLTGAMAAVWQANAANGTEQVPPSGRLSKLLPSNLPGVKIEDIPLGPDEFVDGQAKEKMDYDDVLNRAYNTPNGIFSIYIGYWARGKRSPSHVAAHIPDRCWTLAGMTCLERKADYQLARDGPALALGYWRRFRQPNSVELETVFWHVVGKGFYDYGGGLHEYTSPTQRVVSVIRDLFFWRQDQYFIRVVSSEPIANFAHDATFNAVMSKVALLGLQPR